MPSKLDRVRLRDGAACPHCGSEAFLTLQHRAGRGMGGSRLADRPSNLIGLCASLNVAIEQDAELAEWARSQGWKLRRWQASDEVPFYDIVQGAWYRLDDRWGRVLVEHPRAMLG